LNRNSARIPRRFCLTAVLRGLERSGNPALRDRGEASNCWKRKNPFPAPGGGKRKGVLGIDTGAGFW